LLIAALPVTFLIAISSFILGSFFAVILAVIRINRTRVLLRLADFSISFLRGTPQLLQLFLVFYGLPLLLKFLGFKVGKVNPVIFTIVALAFSSSAFLSEIIRSAYLGVEKGQIEAAYSVGLSSFQMAKRILFPQMFKIMLPNLGNFLIDLVKNTSLAFSIGIVDIMGKARIIAAAGYGVHQLEVYVAVSLIYWGICVALEKILALFEVQYSKGYADIGETAN
jgi:L-cystine transport system permease protein